MTKSSVMSKYSEISVNNFKKAKKRCNTWRHLSGLSRGFDKFYNFVSTNVQRFIQFWMENIISDNIGDT